MRPIIPIAIEHTLRGDVLTTPALCALLGKAKRGPAGWGVHVVGAPRGVELVGAGVLPHLPSAEDKVLALPLDHTLTVSVWYGGATILRLALERVHEGWRCVQRQEDSLRPLRAQFRQAL